MIGPRRLLTGPSGPALRDLAIARSPTKGPVLWIVPSAMARDQVIRLLAIKAVGPEFPRVFTWDDLWDSAKVADPPARLSAVALGAVLIESIERARLAGDLSALESAVEFPGFRRSLGRWFADFTRLERPVEAPAPGNSPVEAEKWALFRHYRAILAELKAEDPEGWAVVASRSLKDGPNGDKKRMGHLVLIEPVGPSVAQTRAIASLVSRSKSALATLPFDPEPALSEPYSAVERDRLGLIALGFVEEPAETGPLGLRMHGFEAIGRELFRSDSYSRPWLRLDDFRVLGAPKGEGVGLVVAREVQAELARGRHPEDILILVPRLDEDAERIRETIRAWGLPVADGPGSRLTTIPAASALRLAMRLPAEGWDVATLIRLLRNGLVQWGRTFGESRFGPFEAATAIRATRVFRDRSALLNAIDRALDRANAGELPSLKSARSAIDFLGRIFEPISRPATWRIQAERLRSIADRLGLASAELDSLWDALDDQARVFDGLGQGEGGWTWPEFVREVEAIVVDSPPSSPPLTSGRVRIEAVGSVDGASVAVVILANLAESTFPRPEAVEGGDASYAREQLRFLRSVGAAEERLVLAYPTTDLDGSPLLPAGFLDEVIRRLDEETRGRSVEIHNRFDPVLVDYPDLAVAPADARVLAVSMACRDEDRGRLRGLAGNPRHASSLLGAADAFEVAQARREGRLFGPHDGRLTDPAAVAKVHQTFGPDHAFSASQLESFAKCPFQFFQRYVLGLKPIDEFEELAEDYVGRGQDIHRLLETVHQILAVEENPGDLGRLPILVESQITAELQQFEDAKPDVPAVLREIQAKRNHKIMRRYEAQFRDYKGKHEGTRPAQFEVRFGQPDEADSKPHLTFGEADAAVRFQGVIDRIDIVEVDGRVRFRVIDYKTGSSPSSKDVQAGLASQLPLYALAVERLILPDGENDTFDGGYWSLPKDGFAKVKINDWANYRDQLMAYILALVAELRGGAFPIAPLKKGCEKSCDYESVCRIREGRFAGKVWDDRPHLESVGP